MNVNNIQGISLLYLIRRIAQNLVIATYLTGVAVCLRWLVCPLLPCGAGASFKAPIDPKTGVLLSDWQHSAFTSDELQMMSEKVICIGTRAGQDAGNLLIIDIDGSTALEACADRGASPADSGWIIRRNTADDRLKVAFRVPAEDLHRLKGDAADNLLGKAVLNTKSPVYELDADGERVKGPDGRFVVQKEGHQIEVFSHRSMRCPWRTQEIWRFLLLGRIA